MEDRILSPSFEDEKKYNGENKGFNKQGDNGFHHQQQMQQMQRMMETMQLMYKRMEETMDNQRGGSSILNSPSHILNANKPMVSSTEPIPTTSSIAMKAAIDDEGELKDLQLKLRDGAKPSEFVRWKREILDATDTYIKYRPFIRYKGIEQWREFILLNRKYSKDELEPHFIQCAAQLYQWIKRQSENGAIEPIIEQMRRDKDKYNIPKLVGFQMEERDFYKDSHSLIELMTEKYKYNEQTEFIELFNQLNDLSSPKDGDPNKLITEFCDIIGQMKESVPGFPLFPEWIQCTLILDKIPSNVGFGMLKRQLMERPYKDLTLSYLRQRLNTHWIEQRRYKKIQDDNNNNNKNNNSFASMEQGGTNDSNSVHEDNDEYTINPPSEEESEEEEEDEEY
jgi:hypothetical protein